MENSTPHSFLEKQNKLVARFSACRTPEEKYNKIIELGAQLLPFSPTLKTPDNLVRGCQSLMYLHAELINGKLHLQAHSEALISAGLAALLLHVYNEEPIETILQCPPLFLQELGIFAHLTPSRSNGLSSLFLAIKQRAVGFAVTGSAS